MLQEIERAPFSPLGGTIKLSKKDLKLIAESKANIDKIMEET